MFATPRVAAGAEGAATTNRAAASSGRARRRFEGRNRTPSRRSSFWVAASCGAGSAQAMASGQNSVSATPQAMVLAHTSSCLLLFDMRPFRFGARRWTQRHLSDTMHRAPHCHQRPPAFDSTPPAFLAIASIALGSMAHVRTTLNSAPPGHLNLDLIPPCARGSPARRLSAKRATTTVPGRPPTLHASTRMHDNRLHAKQIDSTTRGRYMAPRSLHNPCHNNCLEGPLWPGLNESEQLE